jgi:hypothetical protein
MDKQLARRNIRMGAVLGLVLLLMLGITFIWASLYINTIG